MSSRIFISHSRTAKDETFGRKLVADLRALMRDNSTVWYDSQSDIHGDGGINASENFWRKIVAEITERDIFIIIMSPDSMSSEWVRSEFDIAYNQRSVGKQIVPILFRQCEAWPDLAPIHYVSFLSTRTYAQAFAELILAIRPRLGGSDPLEALPGYIFEAVEQQDWDDVIAKTDFLISADQGLMTAALWRVRGLAFVRQNDGDKALEALDKALELAPYESASLAIKGRALMLLERYREAAEVFKKALALVFPGHQGEKLGILNDLCTALRADGDWEEALHYAQSAARLDPENATWLSAQVDILLQWNHPVEALTLVRALTARPKASAALWLLRARLAYEHANNLLEVKAALDSAEQVDPGNPVVSATRHELLQDTLQTLWDLGFKQLVLKGVEVILPPLCNVHAGPFLMGNTLETDPNAWEEDESPQERLRLGAFKIGKYPVTVAEYACAVRAKAVHEPVPPPNWEGVTWREQLMTLNRPVICVAWADAVAYAAWLNGLTGGGTAGETWRLPTEAEWEKAARGEDGWIYPGGNDRDPALPVPPDISGEPYYPAWVGARADYARSSYGVEGMVGNIWQWCSSRYMNYPYRADDGREDLSVPGDRILRGGLWDGYPLVSGRAAGRLSSLSGNLLHLRGFRLAYGPPTFEGPA